MSSRPVILLFCNPGYLIHPELSICAREQVSQKCPEKNRPQTSQSHTEAQRTLLEKTLLGKWGGLTVCVQSLDASSVSLDFPESLVKGPPFGQ